MKKLLILSLALFSLFFLVGCFAKEQGTLNSDELNNDNLEGSFDVKEITDLAKDINNNIYSDISMNELTNYFNSIKDKFTDEAFKRYFDTSRISVANTFTLDYSVINSSVVEAIIEDTNEAGLFKVVVISEIKYVYPYTESGDNGHYSNEMDGYVTNVYTFSSDTGKLEKISLYR